MSQSNFPVSRCLNNKTQHLIILFISISILAKVHMVSSVRCYKCEDCLQPLSPLVGMQCVNETDVCFKAVLPRGGGGGARPSHSRRYDIVRKGCKGRVDLQTFEKEDGVGSCSENPRVVGRVVGPSSFGTECFCDNEDFCNGTKSENVSVAVFDFFVIMIVAQLLVLCMYIDLEILVLQFC